MLDIDNVDYKQLHNRMFDTIAYEILEFKYN